MARRGNVHIGCSGWNYCSWRGAFYPADLPARSWLQAYAQRFRTVEVNATFYRLPTVDTVEHWIAQTDADFLFAVKASRFLTHVKRLSDVASGIARFYERIEPLARKRRLGPVLWQLPESFARNDDRLAHALEHMPPGRHAFEFRHPTWFTSDVYALMRAHGAGLVIGDHPDRPFQEHSTTADWRYIRLHYGARGRRGNYSERELESWARRLRAWREKEELFVYFNNDWECFAPRNAAYLAELMVDTSQ